MRSFGFKSLVPFLLLSSFLAGCYLRKELDPEHLVPNQEMARNLNQLNPPSPQLLKQSVQKISDHARYGSSTVSDQETLTALETIGRWQRLRDARIPTICFSGIDSVVNLFQDPSEEVRYAAVETAGKVGCHETHEALLAVRQNDPSRLVREAATEALITLGLTNEAWGE
jgi:hypothetical protein